MKAAREQFKQFVTEYYMQPLHCRTSKWHGDTYLSFSLLTARTVLVLLMSPVPIHMSLHMHHIDQASSYPMAAPLLT